jgi:simple sugar transport system ATP-binding protein
LEGVGLSKHFGAVTAVEHVDIQLRRGVVTALVGDNGAGKSTVVKMLTGALAPDEGRLLFMGEEVRFRGPRDARRLGIEAIWQNLALSDNLDVASNLFLGRELVYGSRLRLVAPLRFKAMAKESEAKLHELGARVTALSGVPARNMSGGQQQAIAIAKAAGWATRVLFMDEPTAALGVQQSERVLDSAKQLAAKGVAVLIISHSIPQILEVADLVIVLRHGRKVAELPAHQATPERIVTLMVFGSETNDVGLIGDASVRERER